MSIPACRERSGSGLMVLAAAANASQQANALLAAAARFNQVLMFQCAFGACVDCL